MAGRVSSPLFVGRREELSTLGIALASARDGHGSLVLLGGEAGVGKSRLISELADRAARDAMAVGVGECLQLGDTELSYAPVLAAVRSLARDGLTPALDDETGEEQALPMPDLSLIRGPVGSRFGAPAWQGPVFERLLEPLIAAARAKPLLLVIEDFQWADRSTHDFISFLVRAARDEPVALVISYRSDELDRRHPLRPSMLELERTGRANRIDLAPFTRSELREQVAAIRGEPPAEAFVDQLLERSEGNPFFTEELLASSQNGSTPLPESLRDTLLARIECQSPAVRRVLRIAAVAGRTVDHAVLAAAADLPQDELNVAVRDAVENRLLTYEDAAAGYSFRHALLREAIYGDLLPGERSQLHGTLARVLEDPGLTGAAATEPAELAHHWFAAGEVARAIDASLAAAAAAERVYASGEAWLDYRCALDIWDLAPPAAHGDRLDRVEVMRRAAEAALRTGEFEHAVEMGRKVIAAIDEREDPASAGLAHERLGRYVWTSGQERDAVSEYRRAVELLPPGPPSEERALVLAAEGQVLMLCNRMAESNVRCQEALEIARAVGAEAVEAHVLNTACATRSAVGDVDGALGAAREAGTIAGRLGLTEQLLRSYINGSDALDQAGRVEESIAMAREGLASARTLGADRNWGNFLRAEIAGRLLQRAEWEEAEQLLNEVIDSSPAGTTAGDACIHLGHLLGVRGEFELGRQALDEAAEHVPSSTASQWLGPLAGARIELELWAGRPEEAASLVAATLDQIGDSELVSVTARLYELGTRACAELAARALHDGRTVSEQRANASELVRRLDRLSERLGDALPPGAATRRAVAAAETSRIAGSGDAGLWAEVQSRWDASGHRFDAAYARWRRADALLGAGTDRHEAQTLAREAHSIAVELGARPLRDGVERLARRARIDLVTEEQPASSPNPLLERLELTPRELEVLALLADGMTNREIATELFISDKTASVHVSRILAKLSVPNRTAAAAAAHQLGITRA